MDQINGIGFTPRELDILACLLGGRSAKKTASFLAISPRTVEHHLRNIMMKLGCNSQEKIIDHIEKSNDYLFLKNHYGKLHIELAFKEELRKFANELTPKACGCLMVYNTRNNKQSVYFDNLAKYLSMAGVSTDIENESQSSTPDQLIQKVHPQTIHYIIQHVSEDRLKIIAVNISLKSRLSYDYHDLETLDITKVKNHFHMVFIILQQIYPAMVLQRSIERFEKNCQFFVESNSEGLKISKNCTKEESTSSSAFEKTPWKRRLLSVFILGFFLFSLILVFIELPIEIPYNTKVKFSDSFSEWKLPRQDQIFIGRKTLLKELNRKLHKTNKTVILSGLGGAGKTQLALQYIHHNKHRYRLRAWFRCENMLQLHHEYIKLCTTLGFSQINPNIESAQIFLKNWLARHPGWLIVYDNVISYEEIKSFLPEKGGEVIITSRLQDWPNGFEVLPLDVMSEEESVELLKSVIHRNLDKEKSELINLARTLGHLPLALTQAGAYIHQTQVKVSEYLNLFKRHEGEMMAESVASGSEPQDKNSLTNTWNITLKQLTKETIEQKESLIALDLLMVCSYLAPEKISRDLLLLWLKNAYPNLSSHELTLSKIIGKLWCYSLISMETDGDIRLHRLLQSVLRNKHKKGFEINEKKYSFLTAEWYDKILNSCCEYFNINEVESQIRDRNYIAHLQSLENHDSNLWPNSMRPVLCRFLTTMGVVIFNSSGDQKSALNYERRALTISEKHPEKVGLGFGLCLNNIGWMYDVLGDPKTARLFLEQTMQFAERNPLYKQRSFFALELSNLGHIYSRLGETKKAKELLELAAQLIEEHYGKEHAWAASNLVRLGELYGNMGETTKELEALKNALRIRMKYYDKNDIKIADTLFSLGKAYQRAGDAKAAKCELEKAIEIYQNVFGEKGHVLIAKYLKQLGSVYRDLKEPRRSKQILDKALNIQMQYYEGQEQCLDILDTKIELGATYNDLGNFHQAKEFLEAALIVQEQYYGKDHIHVANTLFNLSKVYLNLKDTKMARAFMQRSHDIFLKTYGKDHLLTEISNPINN